MESLVVLILTTDKMLTQTQLREDVTKCMTDPIYDIIQNFSLEKSKEWYEKRKKQWES